MTGFSFSPGFGGHCAHDPQDGLICPSPHWLEIPMTLTQNPGVGKDPVRQFCDFPALLVRDLSLCGDASRDTAVGSKREAEQVGSCQLSPSFKQSRASFNTGKQTGVSFHFV